MVRCRCQKGQPLSVPAVTKPHSDASWGVCVADTSACLSHPQPFRVEMKVPTCTLVAGRVLPAQNSAVRVVLFQYELLAFISFSFVIQLRRYIDFFKHMCWLIIFIMVLISGQ